jgi:recombination protein RecA
MVKLAKKPSGVAAASEETNAIKRFIAELNEAVGKTSATLVEDGMLSDVRVLIPTGTTLLDIILGGGFPTGRAVEVFGRAGSGKTTLATATMINCQRMGGHVMLLDTERKFFKARAMQMGLDTKNATELKSESLEQVFLLLCQALTQFRTNPATKDIHPLLIVLDTIAALPCEAELEGDKFGQGMMIRPRLLHEAMRKLIPMLSEAQACLMIVNQVIVGPSQKGDDSPGGMALKHHITQRLRLKRLGALEDSDKNQYAINVEAQLYKNQMSGSYTTHSNKVVFPVLFRPNERVGAIDDMTSLVEYLIEQDIPEVKENKAWIKFDVEGKTASCYRKDIQKTVVELGIYDWLKEKAKDHMIWKES